MNGSGYRVTNGPFVSNTNRFTTRKNLKKDSAKSIHFLLVRNGRLFVLDVNTLESGFEGVVDELLQAVARLPAIAASVPAPMTLRNSALFMDVLLGGSNEAGIGIYRIGKPFSIILLSDRNRGFVNRPLRG